MQVEGGSVLGERYVLERRLAVGGMGEVWCAHDRLLGRPVALKVPRPEVRADPGFGDRLLAEARHAAAVHHPGIAEVYDVSAAEPLPYLVLELVDGRPLSRIVAEEAPLPPERARRLVCQVAEALDAAHAAGLVHRDVKPANLLVTADDTVKVTDFGIARAVDSDSITRTGFVTGTAQYLSPEQAGGRPASSASDMYALGVVAFELLTGRRPYEGDPLSVLRAHREDPVPPLPAAVPADLARLVLGLLSKDPAQRPTSAQVMGRDELPAGEVTGVLPQPAPAWPVQDLPDATAADDDGAPTAAHALPHRRRAHLALTAAGAVVLLLAVLGLGGGDGDDDGPGGSAQAAATAPAPLPVTGVSLFHPGGSDGDYPDEVGHVVDGDPATTWRTQRYGSADFGSLRPGVGLLFDLGEARAVRELHLSLVTPGLALRLHAGDRPGEELLATPALATVPDAPGSTVVPLPEPVTARYWVVWVERLPVSGRHQASVAEASLLG